MPNSVVEAKQRMQQVLSAATVAAIGLTCKAYLHSGLCSISVRGLPYLLDALESPERQSGQGVLTGESFHISFPTSVFPPVLNCEELWLNNVLLARFFKSLTISRRAPFHLLDCLCYAKWAQYTRTRKCMRVYLLYSSSLDDPLTWGILPARTYLHSHLTRWTLGASDIIFTNP